MILYILVNFPGMTVSGTVILVTDETKDYKDIEVRIVGRGEVYWTETRTMGLETTRELKQLIIYLSLT